MKTHIELKGLSFAVSLQDDRDNGAPWENSDGHGKVRYVRNFDEKTAGERVLTIDRNTTWLYDWAEALERAKREQWGLVPDALAALAKVLGHAPSADEITEAAVEADFRFLQGWCDGSWNYVGVRVVLRDSDGNPTDQTESLWGVESNSDAYIDEVALELAAEIGKRVGRRKYISRRVQVRQ